MLSQERRRLTGRALVRPALDLASPPDFNSRSSDYPLNAESTGWKDTTRSTILKTLSFVSKPSKLSFLTPSGEEATSSTDDPFAPFPAQVESQRIVFRTVTLRRISPGKHQGGTERFFDALALNPALGRLVMHLHYIGEGRPLSAERLLPYLHHFTDLKTLDGDSWDSLFPPVGPPTQSRPSPRLCSTLSVLIVKLGHPLQTRNILAAIKLDALRTLKIDSIHLESTTIVLQVAPVDLRLSHGQASACLTVLHSYPSSPDSLP